MSLLPAQYLDTTVSIGVKLQNGSIAWIGTGFLVKREAVESSPDSCFYLVTNKHVLSYKYSVVMRIPFCGGGDAQFNDCEISLIDENGMQTYAVHENDDIDIAVLPLSTDVDATNSISILDIDDDAKTSDELAEYGVAEGVFVYMLGYPLGLVNACSSKPICRLGCIARMSDLKDERLRSYIVDMQNFPGSSGSPIFVRPEILKLEGSPEPLKQCSLIGVAHGFIPWRDNLKSEQTDEIVEVRTENSGLALVYPVELIREAIDSCGHIE